ncbi:MAG TPA: MBL fold metallo-hydrolase [bacterium]|nr:MBL fold metallo-hydrolase [bacterium]HPN29841.1 MBL fold metallo-hydrolase [bacterium]
MIIKFWGVRGSLPTPSKNTIKYGGNTACVELRNRLGEILIIDAGTGIRMLGSQLMKEFGKNPIEAQILLSHTHWDHIQGIPFFIPLYIPGNKFDFIGPYGTKRDLKDIINLQMDHDFFPLNFDGLPSSNFFKQMGDDEETNYKHFNIKTKVLNHGGLGSVIGFKISFENKTVVYSSDHEGYELFFKSNSGKTQKVIDNMEAKYRKFIEGADLLIHDAQYDSEDYNKKKGWGHSSIDYAINIALAAAVKKLYIIHYDPDYSDEKIDGIIESKKKFIEENELTGFELAAAVEGLEIKI